MKRKIFVLLFIFCVAFTYGQSLRKVAILPVLDKANSFDGAEGYAKKLMLRMSLHAAISSVDGFMPLDRTDFSAAMNEASFQRSGAVSDDEIRAIGEQYGATHVLIAEIAKVDAERMILSAKITNVQSSASKAALPIIVQQDISKMSEACMNLAADLLDAPSIGVSLQGSGEYMSSTEGMEWTHSEGDKGTYIGQLLNGVPHGKGEIKYNEGQYRVRYSGEFVNGKQQGYGEETYSEGRRYEGEFKDGLRHGNGIFYFPSGGRYEGEYRIGMKHGRGTLYYADGNRYEGDWKDGKKHGKGVYYYTSGNRYEGEFRNNRRYGFGIYYYADGRYRKGQYVDGKATGTHYIYSASGELIETKKY